VNATALLGALAAMAIVGGLLLTVTGLRKTPPRPDADGPTRRPSTTHRRLTSRVQRRLGLGVLLGLLLWLVTGYLIAVAIAPIALLVLPTLLAASPGAGEIARLEGMESWTRSLTGVLDVGVGLEQAIISASLRATPVAIGDEIRILVARVRAHSDLPTVLRAFADDLDDATGDIIVATLLAGATQRGKGLVDVLEALADTVADEVRIRRTIEAERAPKRTTARIVTVFSIVLLTGLFLLTNFMDPYASPLGQLLLGVLLLAFFGALMWLTAMTKTKPLPRFIGDNLRTRPRRPVGATS
jgi:tight adherence protein B